MYPMWIAYWMFCGLLAFSFGAVFTDHWAEAKEALSLFFPLVVFWMGLTMGYYVGKGEL